MVVARGELRDGEAATGHEAGGPDFHHGLASGHGPNDTEGHDQREDGQDAARGGAEQVQIQAGDASQGDEGAAQSAVGHGSGVADEGQAGGLEGAEAQTDQHGGRNRHRGAEAGRALDEGPEAEGDQQGLDAAVARQPGDGVLHHLEVTGLDGDVVDEDGVQHDPADGQEAEGRAVPGGGEGRGGRHLVGEDGGVGFWERAWAKVTMGLVVRPYRRVVFLITLSM